MILSFLDAGSLGPGLDFGPFQRWGEVKLWESTTLDERIPRLANTTVAIANRIVFDDDVFSACPELRLILLTATGYNTVDLDAARRHHVAVCNVVGYSTASVAQHTFALLLSLMEQISWLNEFSRETWPGSRSFGQLSRPFHEIDGKRWGILGLGNIGTKVAQLAEGFGAHVQFASISGVKRETPWPQVSVDELLQSSDIVTIHAPLNEVSRGLLGPSKLRQMKPSAYLVNVGRGGIIDETALAEALDAGNLAGAALDVMLPEPPDPTNPLLHLKRPERLVLSPHLGWASIESRTRCLDEVLQNLRSWREGGRRNRLD